MQLIAPSLRVRVVCSPNGGKPASSGAHEEHRVHWRISSLERHVHPAPHPCSLLRWAGL